MSKIKIAFAQINYKPTFVSSQANLLIEPFGDETTSISKLSYQGSGKLKK